MGKDSKAHIIFLFDLVLILQYTILHIPDYISFTKDPAKSLQETLKTLRPDRVAYLVDENTRVDCLPLLGDLGDGLVIEIASGEINKNLDTCQSIWTELTNAGFSRKSLLVNVGGGVIGDMGGFCASTYKRGIRFVNFPTTLLAAVDANIGGKLGIDFNGFKNHIGIFNDPDAVIICDRFLKTLPERELKSGFAEVIKHGLIFDRAYLEEIKSVPFPEHDWHAVIRRSAEIKGAVVAEDPKEKGLRKILNYGHTLGHGIETWYLNAGKSLLHGEAIAVGMILEAYLANKIEQLSLEELEVITGFLIETYGKIELPPLDEVLSLVVHDKKNTGSKINYSLLTAIGKCSYDDQVDPDWISKSFSYYQNLK
ncbi:MAG: 3-dehydroquinate synthase [Cyclobacteriaceae bacterium]